MKKILSTSNITLNYCEEGLVLVPMLTPSGKVFLSYSDSRREYEVVFHPPSVEIFCWGSDRNIYVRSNDHWELLHPNSAICLKEEVLAVYDIYPIDIVLQSDKGYYQPKADFSKLKKGKIETDLDKFSKIIITDLDDLSLFQDLVTHRLPNGLESSL